MSINQSSESLGNIFGNKVIRDLMGEHVVGAVRDGGVRMAENGLDRLRTMDPNSILGIADQIFRNMNQPAPQPAQEAPAKSAPAKEAPVAKEAPTEAPVKEEPKVEVKVEVKETVKAPTVDADKVSESLTFLTGVFSLLAPQDRDTAIASVMNLVEASSSTGLTGEHAKWIARLYGSTQL